MKRTVRFIATVALILCWASPAWTAEVPVSPHPLDLTRHPVGYAALAAFTVAYVLAMFEEAIDLRKSKPMMIAAALIWTMIAGQYHWQQVPGLAQDAFRHYLGAYTELLLFIIVSMTYLNAMEDRLLFEKLRVWLLGRNFSYRRLFWITGALAFVISSVLNNLTTALVMGAVITAMGRTSPRFVAIACINVVVAANAGGSFSPFGDITTLLVWQSGAVPFQNFFRLLLPSIVNFLVPALIMSLAIPNEIPAPASERVHLKRGARRIIYLFLATIATAVCFENLLDLPAAAGMMAGLGYLQLFDFYLIKTAPLSVYGDGTGLSFDSPTSSGETDHLGSFDVFHKVSRLEWDTLLFFYGVMLSVGGLSFAGYLELAAQYFYGELHPTLAHVLVGMLSAFIDNGTIMYAVLTMEPQLSQGQWLLVTLTTGVGGSLLAIGSAAGVGLLGQARGLYTFSRHLAWAPVIALGYAASIGLHFLLNTRMF